MAEAKDRWESTDAFIATCNAIHAINEAKKEIGESETLITIQDINTIQELLVQQGYSIQKINPQSP